MLVTFITVLTVLRGVQGDVGCEEASIFARCDEKASTPTDDLKSLLPVPDGEQIKRVCPLYFEYVSCFEENVLRCGDHAFPQRSGVVSIISTRELVQELCNETSVLHNNYIQSVSCYRRFLDIGSECKSIVRVLYQDFLKSRAGSRLEREEETDFPSELCRKEIIELACISGEILDYCGDVAHMTFLQIIYRSGYLSQICSTGTIRQMRAIFLRFLGSRHPQINVYRAALDTFAGYFD